MDPPGWSAPAGGGNGAPAWLRSAAVAPRRVSYEGTKAITVWGGQVQASQVRIYHEAPNLTRLEYLAAGSQPKRIVIIKGRSEIEYVPARNQVIERSAAQPDEAQLTQAVLPQLLANYNVTFGSGDQVAGRDTRIVNVQSKFPGRPSLRIWVDQETRIILRFERYRPDGNLQEASAFISVQFDPTFAPNLFELTPPPGAQVQVHKNGHSMEIAEIAQRVGFTPQMPAYLPSGFRLARSGVITIRGEPAAAFAYSDGISALTLFESRGAQGLPPRGHPVRIGSVDGMVASRGNATLVHWNVAGISFTLVGELAEGDLVRIAASIPSVSSRVAPVWPARAWARVSGFLGIPAAEAAQEEPPAEAELGVPPVPISPYITTDTHPIGPGIRTEEERIWHALRAAGLTPFVVKVTVASDGVSRLPNGLIGHLAWIWFVYGMGWTGDRAEIVREVQASARAVASTAFQAEPRVGQIVLTAHYQVSGRFEGRRSDITFTARLFRDRWLEEPSDLAPAAALERGGDVWYSPALLAGALTMRVPHVHEPRLPDGSPLAGALQPGDRTEETTEHFDGGLFERVRETKDRLDGILFGMKSGGRFWRGNPRRREIALTFDDGPGPMATPLLLAILRRYGVHATFFVIGERVAPYPYLVRQMAAEGHEVANHTFHHPNLTTLDAATVRQEVDAAAELIGATAGRPRWFRPPGGDYDVRVVEAARASGMDLAMWTANSGDWALPPPKVLAERVLDRAEPGAIILLHNGPLNTVRALPTIITELRRRGYALVTMSDLARETAEP